MKYFRVTTSVLVLPLIASMVAMSASFASAAAHSDEVQQLSYSPAIQNVVTLAPQGRPSVEMLTPQGNTLTMQVPATAGTQGQREGEAIIFAGENDYRTRVETTGGDFRAVITIDNSSAPREYRFPIDLPAGYRLLPNADGSLTIVDTEGQAMGGFHAPWAKDATGTSVRTRYRIEGTTLVQEIEHAAGMAYPLVADPDGFWGWAKCVGSVGALVAGNALIAFKVAKLGGVWKAARLIAGASNAEEKWKVAAAAFGELTGVSAVVSSCS